MTKDKTEQYCGYAAIVGRPNVGKSTLLNHILGQKLSITSRKPQTTRHNLLGIKTEGDTQIIFVDTPGLHFDQTKALNRYMNQAAESALKGVDVIVFIIDRDIWNETDQRVAEEVFKAGSPVIIAINKLDRLISKTDLFPHIQSLAKQYPDTQIIPISALHGQQLKELELEIKKFIPAGVHYFPDEQVTDKSERFLVAELIREKITRQLGAELPYEATIEIESFKHEGKIIHINALILVEREGQKKIIIGDKGARLKKIGQDARLDMERLLENKVMLSLWVKVRRGWSDDDRALQSLGYEF
ncbi:MAG: GTPase Era [Porticoccus sp.]|jgi:GTP-binding protein Era|uniref:GTPase Era n=1 Tax=Porticoccus sp. Uisw_050_02 TaxID=3230978 RepID=UPI00309976BC|tara:strand:+ start:476 stop:1378 length:903 start_codon:yes stop_codon:yes gene_type:complete